MREDDSGIHDNGGQDRRGVRGADHRGRPGRTAIDTITTDSRELGTNSLFVPLSGRSLTATISSRPLSEGGQHPLLPHHEGGVHRRPPAGSGIAEILCDDTLQALGAIAARHRDAIDPIVIGITGTNGKTTTKELVYAHPELAPERASKT